jgi:hypothetical protein
MPQLDHVTFFSQYFWLCIFFLTFYAALYRNFLPKLARIMKTRKKQMLNFSGNSVSDESTGNVQSSPVINAIKESKAQLNKIVASSATWSTSVVIQANNKDFLISNQSYLENLANNNVLQNTILFDLNMIGSQSVAGKGPAKEKLFNRQIVQQLFV